MPSIIDQIDRWAEQAQIWSVWLLTFLATALAIAGVIFFWFDIRTSYYGWGKFAETHTTIGDSSFFLAAAISVLPTLFQAAWVVAKTGGVTFVSDHRILSMATFVMFVLDTALDTYQLYDTEGGFASLLVAAFIAIAIFGVCSEFLLSFFTPIAFTLWQNILSNTDWNFAEAMGPHQQNRDRSSRSKPKRRRR